MIFLQSKLKHLKVMILKKSEFKSSQSFVKPAGFVGVGSFVNNVVFFKKMQTI